MFIKNDTNSTIVLGGITFPPNETIYIPDSYKYHPQFIPLFNTTLKIVDGNINNIQQALENSINPNMANTFVTQSMLSNSLTNIKTHQPKNDPSDNEKEAMSHSTEPSGSNPFATLSILTGQVTQSMSDHILNYSHSEQLTANEVAAIQNSSIPSALNPIQTLSAMQGHVLNSISIHSSNATIHHDNSHDPTHNQKNAMDAADSPDASNPFTVASDLTTHTSNAVAHHSNLNDPTTGQKQALAGSYGTPSSSNRYITETDTKLLTTDQKAAISGSSSPSGSNVFVTNSDARLSTSLHLTADQQAALVGTNGTPNTSNKFVTNTDTRLPSSDEKAALVGTNGTPSTLNKFVTSSDTRLPTSDEKAGLAGTASASNKYITEDYNILKINDIVYNTLKLTLDSTTQITISGKVFIDNEDCTISSIVSNSGLIADTTYYIYCDKTTNSIVTNTPSITNYRLMYDGKIFVGCARTNSSSEFIAITNDETKVYTASATAINLLIKPNKVITVIAQGADTIEKNSVNVGTHIFCHQTSSYEYNSYYVNGIFFITIN